MPVGGSATGSAGRRPAPPRPDRQPDRPAAGLGSAPARPTARRAGAARARINVRKPAPVAPACKQKARQAPKARKRAKGKARGINRRARSVSLRLLHAGRPPGGIVGNRRASCDRRRAFTLPNAGNGKAHPDSVPLREFFQSKQAGKEAGNGNYLYLRDCFSIPEETHAPSNGARNHGPPLSAWTQASEKEQKASHSISPKET